MVANFTGSDGVFNIAATLTAGGGTIVAPPDIPILNGDTGAFDVEITPDVCLPDGGQMAVSVDVDGNMFNAHADITYDVSKSGAGKLTPYCVFTVAGDIQVMGGPEVCRKNICPHRSNTVPHGLGIFNCALRSKWKRFGL